MTLVDAGPLVALIDAGEPGISGVSVWLDWAGPNGTFDDGDDISLGRQFTDADGLYQFAGVPAGQLRARVTEVIRIWNPNIACPALTTPASRGRPARNSSGTSQGWMASRATTMPAMLASAPMLPISHRMWT